MKRAKRPDAVLSVNEGTDRLTDLANRILVHLRDDSPFASEIETDGIDVVLLLATPKSTPKWQGSSVSIHATTEEEAVAGFAVMLCEALGRIVQLVPAVAPLVRRMVWKYGE